MNKKNIYTVTIIGLGNIGLLYDIDRDSDSKEFLSHTRSAFFHKNFEIKYLVDKDLSKLELAKKLGATHIFNSKDNSFEQKILHLTDGGAHRCVESAGQVATIELGFSLIRNNGGKIIFASHPPNGEKIKISPHELISGKLIEGSWGGATNPDQDIPVMYDLFLKSNLPLDTLITRRYKLKQINEALDDLEAGRVFRPLIVMEH